MAELKKENSTLKDANNILNQQKRQRNSLQKNPQMDENTPDVIGLREEKRKKYQTFIRIDRPSKPSSDVNLDKKTLKRRADRIHEVLKAVSARENPSDEDIITTLATYLRRHPEIALPACQSARIQIIKELTTKETVDLKVLLKLPMKKLRDLRRFLSNHNIKLFPSEHPIYNELKARQSISSEIVEIGILKLQEVANGPATKGIAFARVKNLREYLTEVVNKQAKLGNINVHESFNDEIWLKVGGDKGGSSTKLVGQFANQKDGCSADATNILGMFNATDTYDNLSEVFGLYHSQIADLMDIKTIIVNGIEKRLRIFLYGDYEFLCKYMGHMGPASSFPCLWCNVTLQELRKNTDGEPHCPRLKNSRWANNANWARPKTREQYVQDYADMQAAAGGRTITGHMFHSISKKPLFPLPESIEHIVPPSLHILLGLGVRYFNLLELECRKLDQGNMADEDLAQYADWLTASADTKVAEIEYMEAKCALESDESLLKSFERAQRGRNVNAPKTDPCSMPICALASSIPEQVNRDNVQWIRCSWCGEGMAKGWYHAYCAGIKEDDVTNPAYDAWTCQVCKNEISGPEDVIPCQKERIISNKALTKQKEKVYLNEKKKLDKVYEKIARSRGQFEKKLNERLENDLGIKRQAYHSQCFVGNDCKKIVNHVEILLQDLPDGPVKNKFQGLFGRLRRIFSFFKADFLTPTEVKELCLRCWDLGYFFPANFPKESIPPKLHILICHIPEMAIRWKTVGLLSEQGLESLHASINSIKRVYASVRDKEEHMKLVLGCHQQRGVTSKEGFEVSPEKARTCRKSESCKGRYKVKEAGGKKERVCIKCNHVVYTFPT
ncbi:uncharacterized protein [Amphiura filiformis]|uniref:uncharacterized protein n=1 Tax=Amphiura filiformis TaxID=82378 RepID=UPI003B211423